ncbi:GNAT family N-acetyltransferase [Lacrimispora aerotolerans]|uniref:GNAT family N-acetyltransferase n=1 Tax=Lacrimispora aerotolerans TaxID=36832 RepID=UPI00047B46E6|nr:GNAT family N-acetyltransferase [Lacrimispora aerotolerans]
MKVYIKKANYENAEELREIGIETFVDTFESQNSPESIKEYIEKAFSKQKLIKELEDKSTEFYFIFYNNEMAGYLKVNTGDSQTEKMGNETLEIERIYIRKKYQRKKLGEQLIQKAIEIAKVQYKKEVWLGVWEENHDALAFYERMGFCPIGSHAFFMGEEEQTDLILVKNLVKLS